MTDKLLEGAVSRLWIYGSAILEISTAKAGWSEVVIRRSTGTVAWVSRLENRCGSAFHPYAPTRAHQHGFVDPGNVQVHASTTLRRRLAAGHRHAALAACRTYQTRKAVRKGAEKRLWPGLGLAVVG